MNNSCSNLRRAQDKVNKKETHFLVVKEKLTRLTLHLGRENVLLILSISKDITITIALTKVSPVVVEKCLS